MIKSKLAEGLIWNYVSLCVLAVSGLLINFLIAMFYSMTVLGLFNLVYAVYIIASQFCTAGVHYSVLKHIASKEVSREEKVTIISSAFILCALLAVVFALLIYVLAPYIAALMHKAKLTEGIYLIVPALFFFACNKVYLWAINGLRYMKIYAVGQALRYILMVGFILIVALRHASSYWLFVNFLFAEMLLFIFLSWVIWSYELKWQFKTTKYWFIEHLSFGLRGFMIGVFVEINTRVDILVLGLFVNAAIVGIYSFAAMLVEGLLQLIVVIRNNINPLLARYIHTKDFTALRHLIVKIRLFSYLVLGACVALLIIIYPLIVSWFLPGKGLEAGWAPLIILSCGLFLAAGVLPLNNILTQAGMPGTQTCQNMIIVLSNLLLNFILVPFFGIVGAGVATALASSIVAAISLIVLTKWRIGFNLLNLRTSY